jgi:ABC-2 type transport system ATP-binding protein
MLKVRNLTKKFSTRQSWFGKTQTFTAVDNISFDIDAGQIVGILGPNGAGKTTTIKMLLDILTPTSGTIEYFGKNLLEHRSSIMQHIAFASTYTKLPGRLSVQENLEIYGRLYCIPIKELKDRIKFYLSLLGMQDKAQQTMATLSAGQTTRVMLAKTFLVRPKMMLLDEPTAALDPDIAQEVRSFILTQQKEHGTTIVLASHNMDEVTDICNRVIVLSNGSIIDDASPKQLAQRISNARISLIILDGMKRIVAYAQEKSLEYTVTDRTIEIKIDEHNIAPFLTQCTQLGIIYSHISIAKPTLEDYFLAISRRSSKTSHQKRI